MRHRWLLVAALAASACAGGDDPSSSPVTVTTARPVATTAVDPPGAGAPVVPVGFERMAVTVVNADGTTCELCMWRAHTPAERSRGLMGATDLGDADGMAFVYDAPSSNRFWMRATPLALDIAWFDADGRFVSAAAMSPCLSGPAAACTRYPAAGPYTLAIELPAGALERLGIGPGSVATIAPGTGCPAG